MRWRDWMSVASSVASVTSTSVVSTTRLLDIDGVHAVVGAWSITLRVRRDHDGQRDLQAARAPTAPDGHLARGEGHLVTGNGHAFDQARRISRFDASSKNA